MTAVVAELVLRDEPDAAPRARRALRAGVATAHPDLVEDAALVVTELVSNSLLHGRPPITLRVLETDHGLRVEVEDGSDALPVMPLQAGVDAMTGRGLALVASLGDRWGVERGGGGAGKTVWVELDHRAQRGAPGHDGLPLDDASLDVDALLAGFADDDDAEPTFTVALSPVPTELLLDAKRTIDNIVRELQLEDAGSGPGTSPLPGELAAVIATGVHSFAAARSAIKRQALAAARRGDREVALTLTLPASAAQSGERYLAALDEADRYARNARLLSLESPPVHQVLRRWYVGALVDQLQAAAAGQPPPPPVGFPERLAEAYTRIAPLEAQASRLEALQRITAELTAAATVEDIAATVARSATAVLDAAGTHVYLVDGDDFLDVAAEGTSDPAARERYQRFPRSAATPAAAALADGQVLVFSGPDDLAQRFPAVAGAFAGERSLLVAPMIVGTQHLGVLSASFTGSARIEQQSQRTFLTTLADVTAQALARAQAASAAAQANERLHFLADASLVLAGSLEHRSLLASLARLVVPRLADWCSISLPDDTGQLRPLVIAHVDPDKVRSAEELMERYPTDMRASTGAPQVLRSGLSEWYADVPAALVEASAVDDEHRELLRQLGIRSALTVPLTGRTGTLGVITMVMAESGRRYTEQDVALAEDLARRAALAVGNADAYRDAAQTE